MAASGADVDFLEEFQRLGVEQVDGGALAEGHPHPTAGPDHVLHVAAGVAVGPEPLRQRVKVRINQA